MGFDELMMGIHQRLNEYKRAGRAELIMSDTATSEADQLWRAAQPADSSNPTPDEANRVATARHLLGWLHYLRFEHFPFPACDPSELALALGYLAPLGVLPITDVPTLIPDPLRPMVPGPAADPDAQAGTAAGLLNHAQVGGDRRAVEVAIDLLTEAVGATPHDHPEHATRVANLSVAYRTLYRAVIQS